MSFLAIARRRQSHAIANATSAVRQLQPVHEVEDLFALHGNLHLQLLL